VEERVDLAKVKKLYDDLPCMWPEWDLWFTYTHKYLCGYLDREIPPLNIRDTTKILNAGSDGNTYGIGGEHYHVDICWKNIAHLEHALEASIEEMPYADGSFDGCICMGSVINYCDAKKALFELARVIKPGGFFIFDYDQSGSLEYIFTKAFRKDAVIVDANNSGFADRAWAYLPRYIRSILRAAGFAILNTEYFHILSALINDESRAAAFAKYDAILKYVPLLGKCSCNVILTCRKL